VFDRNGLLALETEPEHEDLAADELNAWSSDVLRVVIAADHPVYFISVGQFDGARARFGSKPATPCTQTHARNT
jgi:hypothetical protein